MMPMFHGSLRGKFVGSAADDRNQRVTGYINQTVGAKRWIDFR